MRNNWFVCFTLMAAAFSVFCFSEVAAQVEAPEIEQTKAHFDEKSMLVSYELFWKQVAGDNVTYLAQCSEYPDFPTGAHTEQSGWITDNSHIFEDKFFSKRYYFRVRSQVGNRKGAWSQVASYAVASISELEIPKPPILTKFHTVVTWGVVEGEDVRYQAQCSPDSTFTTGVITSRNPQDGSDWLTSTKYTFEDLDVNKKYYFRIRPKIDNKEVKDWSRVAYIIGYRFRPIIPPEGVGSFFHRYFLSAGKLIYLLCFAFFLGIVGIIFMYNNTKLSKAFRANEERRSWKYYLLHWSWKTKVDTYYDDFIKYISREWKKVVVNLSDKETEDSKNRNEVLRKKRETLDRLIDELGAQRPNAGATESKKTALSATKLTSFEKIVLAGLKKHQKNFGEIEASEEIDRAVENTAAPERDALEGRALNAIWAIGGICPLLGLFGTVIGIQDSFGSLTESLREGLDITQALPGLSKGINIALLTTIWGLAFGIPLLAAYYYFRAKVDWIYAKWQEIIVEITNEF